MKAWAGNAAEWARAAKRWLGKQGCRCFQWSGLWASKVVKWASATRDNLGMHWQHFCLRMDLWRDTWPSKTAIQALAAKTWLIKCGAHFLRNMPAPWVRGVNRVTERAKAARNILAKYWHRFCLSMDLWRDAWPSKTAAWALAAKCWLEKQWHHCCRSIALWRATSLTKPFQDPSAQTTAELGELGERIASLWLRKHGRKVLYRNYHGPDGGEVDVVCRHIETLVFVEVKTRRRELQHRPADAVNRHKQALIIKAARAWLRHLDNSRVCYRFDIAEVLLHDGEPPEVRVIENAFQIQTNAR